MRSTTTTLLLLMMLLSVPASARQPDRTAQLKEEAYKAFEIGRYGEAIAAFEQAYRQQRDPRLLYNLALAYHKRFQLEQRPGDLTQARDLFQRFLVLVPLSAASSGAERSKLRQVRRLARRYLEQLRRAGQQPPGAMPRSQPTAAAPASRPSPGPVTAPAPPAATPRSPASQPAPREASPGPRRRVLPWVLYGVGAAALTAAAVTGGLALTRASRADDLAAAGDVSGNHRAADAADNLALSTDILLGSAAVAIIVGAVLHLSGGREATRVSWVPGGATVALSY